MKHSESIKNIAPAILRAQSEISVVVANADNPFFKSKYADLEACWEAVRAPLQKEKIAVVQTMGFQPGAGPTLVTTLLHETGEYITGEQPLCAAKDDPQGLGSAISYARRYGLSAILGLIQVDDDGEGAMRRKQEQAKKQAAPKPPAAGPKPVTPPSGPRVVATDTTAKFDLGDFRINFGKKYLGKTLKEIPKTEMEGYLAWLEAKEKEKGTTDLNVRLLKDASDRFHHPEKYVQQKGETVKQGEERQ